METPINANNESQFQYIYNIIKGQGEPYYMPDGSPIYNSMVYLTMPFDAMDIFEERYNSGIIPCRYKYENYIKDSDLQATISGLKLDPDAFWLLLMFLFDYAYSICLSGFTIKDSAQRRIDSMPTVKNDSITNDTVSVFQNILNQKVLLLRTIYRVHSMSKRRIGHCHWHIPVRLEKMT